ncbi:hypothetical protein HDU98_006179, partial [Podochytrium sp. JEL0797]
MQFRKLLNQQSAAPLLPLKRPAFIESDEANRRISQQFGSQGGTRHARRIQSDEITLRDLMGPSDVDENGDPLDVVFEADEDSRTAARDRESLSALESLH